LLETIQSDMFKRAHETFQSRLKKVEKWADFVPVLDSKSVAVIPWCEVEECEDNIKDRSKSYVYLSTPLSEC
jgi:prolyl-tRNA synthetase